MKLLLSMLALLLLLALGTEVVALRHNAVSHPLAHGGRPIVVRKSAQAAATPKVVRAPDPPGTPVFSHKKAPTR